jgi:Transposase DDE domain/Insertion element 4 transposase N-terminal
MYRVRHIDDNDKLIHHLSGHLFFSLYPQEVITACCDQFPSKTTRRVRKFTPHLLILVLLMSTLWPRKPLLGIWKKIARSFSQSKAAALKPTLARSSISYQRTHFDAEILHRLMQTCCQPMCTLRRTPSAFYHGKRLMIIDGSKFNLPDTAANVKAFGRSANQTGPGPCPQIQGVVLAECGSHAVVDVVLGTHSSAEIHALPALLPRLTADMMLLTDSGFFSTWLCEELQETVGANLLCAITSTTGLNVEHRLSDTSYLTTMTPNHRKKHQGTRPVQLRIIEYFIHDERFGVQGQCYRLATTLLDEQLYPAAELITLYHKRWEVENMLDETKTHIREQVRYLRSKTPEGVRQEVYALFLAHYAISYWKCQAGEEAGIDPERVSFTNAMSEVQEVIIDSLRARSGHLKRLITLMKKEMLTEILPERPLRINRREVKKITSKYKPKKRNVPPLAKFLPEEQFMDYVELWERPDGERPVGKKRGRKRTIPSQKQPEENHMIAGSVPVKNVVFAPLRAAKNEM